MHVLRDLSDFLLEGLERGCQWDAKLRVLLEGSGFQLRPPTYGQQSLVSGN